MGYEAVYEDVNLHYGALYVNPRTSEAVEVIDLDSGAGVRGAVLVARGSIWTGKNHVQGGAGACGLTQAETDSVCRALTVYQGRREPESFKVDYPRAFGKVLEAHRIAHAYGGFNGDHDIAVLLLSADEYTEDEAQYLGKVWSAYPRLVKSTNNATIRRVVKKLE